MLAKTTVVGNVTLYCYYLVTDSGCCCARTLATRESAGLGRWDIIRFVFGEIRRCSRRHSAIAYQLEGDRQLATLSQPPQPPQSVWCITIIRQFSVRDSGGLRCYQYFYTARSFAWETSIKLCAGLEVRLVPVRIRVSRYIVKDKEKPLMCQLLEFKHNNINTITYW